MLTKNQFDVLYYAVTHTNDVRLSQRSLAQRTGKSLGSVNSLVKQLSALGYIDSAIQVTASGLAALEPYRVTNAVIMAAGMSSRFAPLSYEKPKALLQVKGDILIEREIRQLQEAGIHDITVVIGYMKEKLFYLEDRFGVKLVINEDYYRYNNPSTLMLVKDQLANTYICSSDNYFEFNPFEPYVYQAYYSTMYTEGKNGGVLLFPQTGKGASPGFTLVEAIPGTCSVTPTSTAASVKSSRKFSQMNTRMP